MSWRPRSGRKLKKIAASSVGEARLSRQDDRLDELVRDATLVALADGCDGIRRVMAAAADERGERPLRAVPAGVAVHRVVAPDDRRDAVGGELGQVVGRGRRRDVAAVGERVHPGALLHAEPSRELEQRLQVRDVRVDAALRDEPEQVHVATSRPRALEGAAQNGVVEE